MKTHSCLIALLLAIPACGGAGGELDGDYEYGTDGGGYDEIGSTSQAISGERPLLVVLIRPPDGTALAHARSWYDDRIFGVSGGRNVQDYFYESSFGRFTFSRAGVYLVTDNTSAAFEQRAGIVSGDSTTTKTRKRARLLAADAGFNYAAYDTNGDGSVTTKELTLLAIDRYSTASGQTGTPSCTSMSGVSVCSGVSLVGHQSGMMNYAHELSHLLSPASVDLYGARYNCNSNGLTLLSCTAGGTLDSTAAYFMDPWHRARYSWINTSRTVTLSTTPSGTQVITPLGYGGDVETFTLQGPNNEAITFEERFRSLNDYENGLSAEGLIAFYRRTDGSGNLLDIPSINNPGTDKSAFTLAPSSCRLDPNALASRGRAGGLTHGSTYRIRWSTGVDSGYLISVTSSYGAYTVSWSLSNAAPSC